jgi:hypothetical protein
VGTPDECTEKPSEATPLLLSSDGFEFLGELCAGFSAASAVKGFSFRRIETR